MVFLTVGELKAFLVNIDDETPLATGRGSESWGNSLAVNVEELVTIGSVASQNTPFSDIQDEYSLTVSTNNPFWKGKIKKRLRGKPFQAVTFE